MSSIPSEHAAQTGAPLYELSAVSRTYGRGERQVHAVREVDLVVRTGERVGIVGESGSGKSTLVRMMAALDKPTSGSIRFRGQDVVGVPEKRLGDLRSSVQMVFQDPRSSLDPRMRIGDTITEGLRSPLLRQRSDVPVDRDARLAEVMTAVGLDPSLARSYPHEFSGGQRQRIAIARALAPKPDVLIADEPVSALDVSVRAHVLNLLHDLVDEYRLTMLFVSHDLAVVRHVCDRVVVLRAGRIVEQGPVEQVYADPQQDYTRELLAAVPHLRV